MHFVKESVTTDLYLQYHITFKPVPVVPQQRAENGPVK